jgi:tetratricopeptide (TPR) repeat protein
MRPFTSLTVTFLCFAVATALPTQAQHDHHRHHEQSYGTVQFATSCSSEAQAHFDAGLALLHHMMYEQARPHFEEAAAADPGCAIAYWGVAMSQLNPLWAPPSPQQVAVARAAIIQARALETPTERERRYVETIAAYFDGEDLGHRERLARWERAQRDLLAAHEDDVDAAAFYALAHLAIAPPDERGVAYRVRGGELLEPLLEAHPDHPGLYHYLIHLYDYPALAERAANVAEAYDALAPDVPHALHMPSHIFVRVGEWPGTVEWNRRSADAALRQPVNDRTSFHHAHAMDYLIYAYLQQGQDERAREVVEETMSIDAYQDHFASAYALAAVPARFVLERGQWEDAAGLPLRPQADFPWSRYPQYEAITYFARGVGAARSGDAHAAHAARERLDELYEATLAADETYWATLVDAQRNAVSAWAAYAEGRHDEALNLLRTAADLEDSVDKHPVTPSDVLPARELLGDLLLKLDRPAEARRAYVAALEISPNRFRSHYGAARASKILGDKAVAQHHFSKLLDFADGDRPALRQAREFVAGR